MTDLREETIRKGQWAAQLLDDGLFNEIFAEIEAEQMAAWKNSPARDTEAREKIWQFVAMLQRIRSYLESLKADGKQAAAELEHENKMRDHEKKFGYRPDSL